MQNVSIKNCFNEIENRKFLYSNVPLIFQYLELLCDRY